MIDKGVNKKCVESLIKAGVFEEFEQTRATLLASFEQIIDGIQSEKKEGLDGQVSMFDMGTKEEKEDMQKKEICFLKYIKKFLIRKTFYGKGNVRNLYIRSSFRKV